MLRSALSTPPPSEAIRRKARTEVYVLRCIRDSLARIVIFVLAHQYILFERPKLFSCCP